MATPDPSLSSAKEKRERLRKLLAAKAADPTSYPLSYGQKALWFLHQLAPQSAAYNLAHAARIGSRLDVAALEHALGGVVARHSILRTTYPARNGAPVQQIDAEPNVFLAIEDCPGISEDALDRRLAEERDRPFHLEQGPILRARLFRRSEKDSVLSLVIHHIAVDFWSLGLIVNDLQELYAAELAGNPSSPAYRGPQFFDYVKWQSEMLAGPEGEALWTYWQGQLGGELPVLQLPSDRARPQIQTYRGEKMDFPISADLTQLIRSTSASEAATPYMLFLAAFDTLLYRCTGQTDILVGSPMLGRTRPELENVAGYLSNPVVLREWISGDLSFRELLGHVRSTVLGALEHQDYPFPLLVEKLQPVRDPSYSPLFQVLYMWDKPQQSGRPSHAGELTLDSHIAEQAGAAFDLSLTVFELERSFSFRLQYNVDIFDAITIERFARSFLTLLENLLANPEVRLSRAVILSESERELLVNRWNRTEAPYPVGQCVHQLFEKQAAETPDAVALQFEDRSLTYRELDRHANLLAARLRKLGIGPDVLAGVCVERSLEMVVALLGVLKAGGAYVPLDPTYPKERLAFMLNDARPPVLLTQEHLRGRIPATAAQVICLDGAIRESEPVSECSLDSGARPENLAYVIYTSGSTGEPKGVEIPHRAMVNLLTSMAREPGLSSRDVLLAVTSFSFDIAALEIFLPLLVGARLVLASRAVAVDGKLLLEQMIECGATVAQGTPATWQMMLQSGWSADVHIQKILCGGEALPRGLADRLLERCGRLFNLYGPTETTIWSSVREIDSVDAPITIGRPIANTRMYVLDSEMEPTPIGIPGELYIGGAGLARGYRNRPDLTAERFVPDPFGGSGERLYKTGDLARFVSHGEIEFLGRLDRQVKVNGHRIELGAIEAVLQQHPAVVETAVCVGNDAAGNRLLTAYVVGSATLTVNELRQFLGEKLPQYMAPAAYVFLDALPQTANRKIDYKALPAPSCVRPKLEQSFVAPRTPEEAKLAEICAQVLGLQAVGVHDNFFDLGGTSLRAVEIVAQANDAGLPLLPEFLFEYQTVAELAEALVASRAGGPPSEDRQEWHS